MADSGFASYLAQAESADAFPGEDLPPSFDKGILQVAMMITILIYRDLRILS